MNEPSWTAQIDQMLAGARDIAKLAESYYTALVQEGVPAVDATTLTVGFIHSAMTMPRDEDAS